MEGSDEEQKDRNPIRKSRKKGGRKEHRRNKMLIQTQYQILTVSTHHCSNFGVRKI